MRPALLLRAGAMFAALALAACTGTSTEGPAPATELVAERLTELSDQASAFSRLDVGEDEITAWGVQGGQLRYWRLLDGVTDARDVAQQYPAVEFAALDPVTVQRRVESLAGDCDTAHYRVTVQALTPSALVTELRCGEEEFAELGDADPVATLLGDEPLTDYSGLSIVETWEQVLAQAAVLDPTLRLAQISIDARLVGFDTSSSSSSNGCQPSLDVAKDGSELSWMCAPSTNQPPLNLSTVTAPELAALQQQAMADADIVDPSGVEVRLGRDEAGVARLAVRQGARSAEVPLP